MNNKDDRKRAAALFAALGAESRLQIVQLLTGNTLCVNALAEMTGISPGAVSQHLRVLKSVGLVNAERRGYFVHYSIAPGAGRYLKAVLQGLLKGKEGKRCVRKSPGARNRRT